MPTVLLGEVVVAAFSVRVTVMVAHMVNAATNTQ
jgi:hypothetical protein